MSIRRLGEALLSAALLLAGAVVAAMAVGIVANVVLRYGFASGILGVFEAAQWGMLAAFFLALPALSRGGHVAVDLFSHHGGERFWRPVDAAVNLGSAAVLALLSWRLVRVASEAAEFGETTNLLRLPQAPFLWLAVAGAGLAAALFAAQAAARLATRR
ncbi:MAG: TRAP transporter small permease [Acetobacteraceae bacterium]|nr:TRAP transporter small permease [Acetobacteraceae bacterium]MCX7684326.1 TRAP transporter small permease [Acetobacteraceae bacterium]